jgi:hypothetical protein
VSILASVGDRVGICVGPAVGEAVGEAVGADVGAGVGFATHSQVWVHVDPVGQPVVGFLL